MIITNALISFYIVTGNPCADGKFPTAHHTIAAPRSIPLGTRVHVEGFGDYVVEDRTNIRYDGRWDIFTDGNREHALKLGILKRNILYEDKNATRSQQVPVCGTH